MWKEGSTPRALKFPTDRPSDRLYMTTRHAYLPKSDVSLGKAEVSHGALTVMDAIHIRSLFFRRCAKMSGNNPAAVGAGQLYDRCAYSRELSMLTSRATCLRARQRQMTTMTDNLIACSVGALMASDDAFASDGIIIFPVACIAFSQLLALFWY